MRSRTKHAAAFAERKANGLCMLCDKPRTNGTRCAYHQEMMFEHNRKRRGYGQLRRCSVCKETGHNKSTHPWSLPSESPDR